MTPSLAPAPFQKEASRATALGLVPAGGVKMLQRLRKSDANPAPGPDCSVPATGCAGTKSTVAGIWGATALMMAVLTEPVSETIVPGAICGAISCATVPIAQTGTQRMTRSAPL